VDIGGHPPFPADSKQLSGNFHNLLFLAVFRVLNFRSHFEALNDIFFGYVAVRNIHHEIFCSCFIPRIDLSSGLSYA
jgi:hypothetical protein